MSGKASRRNRQMFVPRRRNRCCQKSTPTLILFSGKAGTDGRYYGGAAGWGWSGGGTLEQQRMGRGSKSGRSISLALTCGTGLEYEDTQCDRAASAEEAHIWVTFVSPRTVQSLSVEPLGLVHAYFSTAWSQPVAPRHFASPRWKLRMPLAH
jgi:hypothetical protein